MDQKLIGVAISDLSIDGLVALKWASEFLKLPKKKYKLCIIILKSGNAARIGPDRTWGQVETDLTKQIGQTAAGDEIIDKIQEYAKEFRYQNVFGKFCGGPHIQETLQKTIDRLPSLDTLVLPCAGRDGGNMLNNNMAAAPADQITLSGCSIVLVKTDGDNRNTSLSFSVPDAPPAAPPAPLAANPPAVIPPAPPVANPPVAPPPALTARGGSSTARGSPKQKKPGKGRRGRRGM